VFSRRCRHNSTLRGKRSMDSRRNSAAPRAAGRRQAEFRASADINAALTGPDSWRTARSSASLGWALIKDDKVAEGEPILVAARARLLATVGPHDAATQEATARLFDYYRSRHRDAEADQLLRRAGKP